MRKRLFNQQSEPGSRIAATAQRLSVKARIMMALFALMLIPQGTWAQDVDYMGYDTSAGKFVKTTATSGNYTTLTGNSPTTLTDGTYVVKATDVIGDRLDVSGTVNIILCDGVTFTANKGITVSTGDVLNIYAQGEGTGKLIAYGFDNTNASGTLYAAIGGALSGSTHTSTPADYGYVNIYGGQITADASSITGASGIGAFDYSKSCVTTIYGGNVDAMGGPFGTNDTYGIAKLKLGSGVIYYGGSSPNPTTVVADGSQSTITTITTLYRYMSTKESVYNLTVDGKTVRTTNLNDILFSGGTTPTASFDSSANTLSLNGVDISGNISSGLPNLTVQFVGTNKINTDGQSNSSSGAADNAILSYNPSATLTFQKNGDGTLELDGKDTPKSAIAGFASVNYGDGCYLKTDVPTKYSSDDKCYINFANGNAFVDVVTISTDVYYPLWIGTSTTAATQVTTTTITAGVTAGTVTFTPAIGTTSSKLTLNSATLTAKILSGLGDLVVEVLGSNKINSSDSGTIFRSVNKGELTIKKASSDAALELEVFGYDNHPAIQGFHTLSYSNFDLNTSATTPTYGVFNDGSSNIYGLYDPNASVNKAIKQATFAKNYDLWVNGTRVTSANASNIGPSGTDFSFDPTESTLHYRSGGSTSYPILSGLPNLTIKIGSPDNSGDYSKNNISIIKFGAPTGVTIAATSGNLTLSKEDGVTGVQQFEIVAYGSEILIQGFDNVTYSDFVILQDGATYNTTNKQLEYPNPSGSGFVGYGGISATFVTPQDISNYYVADIANKDYTGSALAPAITVMETAASATSLVENTDYTVSYKLSGAVTTPIDANTYNVIIDGKGRYTGSITTKTFTIDPIAVTLSWSGTSFTYDGDSHKPNASATGLIGSDVCNVTVSGEQTNASATAYTATATALDNSNYKLPTDVTKTFVINPVDLSSSTTLSVGTITDQTYSGSEIKPEPSVSIKLGKNTTATTLQAGTDFDYGYANNTNAALSTATPAPTVTITGKGNYTGEKNVKFTINPVDFSTSTAIDIAAIDNQTYTGSEIKPTPTVTFNGNSLTAGTDFRYDYSNNLNVADKNDNSAPTVTIIGLGGNFLNGSTKSKTFTIEQASLATATINPIDPQTFTGSEIKPTPIVTLNGKTLTAGTDFNYGYANNTNAAKSADTSAPTVTVTGKGNFTGTALTKFTINPLAATPDVALTIPTSYVYDGTAKTPAVAVSVSGVALTTDDYSVAYTDNINAGRAAAKATVTLKRNYSGSKVETFDINPLTATLSWGNTTFVYNGTAQAPTATVTNLVGTDVCNVTVGGAETAAGSYTATATALSNANYQLPASPTTTFTILDRTATIDFGDRTFKTYYDANETFIVPDGTTAYIVTGVSGNAVTIQKVSYIKAGVPVLLESTPGSTVAKNVSETFTGNLLKYAAAATPATEKHYLLYKNEFVRASGTISNKVYLDLAGYSGGARSLVIGDGATAIEGIVVDEEDGDAKWFDMQGRRINKPTKAGLYIKDGQKVVVKTRY